MGRILNFSQKSVPRISCVVMVGMTNVVTYFVSPFNLKGTSTTFVVACILPSAVRIFMSALVVLAGNVFTMCSAPFPSIVTLAPESNKPTILLPFISTSMCGRRSARGTVMSDAISMILDGHSLSSDTVLEALAFMEQLVAVNRPALRPPDSPPLFFLIRDGIEDN